MAVKPHDRDDIGDFGVWTHLITTHKYRARDIAGETPERLAELHSDDHYHFEMK